MEKVHQDQRLPPILNLSIAARASGTLIFVRSVSHDIVPLFKSNLRTLGYRNASLTRQKKNMLVFRRKILQIKGK